MAEFYPPRLNPLLARLTQSVSPLVAGTRYRMQLHLRAECLERLTALQDHRLLLLPNHPTHHDWLALFLLSTRLGQLFHYMAAYERFQGAGGWWLQRLGAYSIRRGQGDRPSVAHTVQLLTQPHCRLVIFPEGGYSFQNDTVMPFRVGPVQVAFQSMSRLAKQGQPVPDLYTVPLSLKYRYVGDMEPAIAASLRRLETALHLHARGDFYQRLVAIADQVLTQYEQDYGIPVDPTVERSRNQRIDTIRVHVLSTCEQVLSLLSAPQDPLRERVYRIQRVLESRAEVLAAKDFWTYETIHTAAARLLNFDAIYDGYVAAHPTPERFLDTLTRLERAVFGIDLPGLKGDRRVLLRVGEPVNLKEYFEPYQTMRQAVVDQIVANLQQQVQKNLDALQ